MRESVELARMEKVDLKAKYPKYEGDFIPITEEYVVVGWSTANKKNGSVVEILNLTRIKDGVTFGLFADQLRQDGAKLCGSKRHLDKQLARQVDFWIGQGHLPKTYVSVICQPRGGLCQSRRRLSRIRSEIDAR